MENFDFNFANTRNRQDFTAIKHDDAFVIPRGFLRIRLGMSPAIKPIFVGLFYFTSILLFILVPRPSSLVADSLPKDLKWETNESFPIISSPQAKKGGVIQDFLLSFPLTLRQVGPDSNGGFRSYMDDNQLSLITLHPNTEEWIPVLATHWAFAEDGRAVFYRLDPSAKWSDGKAVTANDFVFLKEFMTSEHIIAPWYNEYYQKEIESIKAYRDEEGREVVAIRLPQAKPDLLYYTNISPLPRHFYQLDGNFVKNYNWKIPPNTGPYQITEVKKGKSITFSRKQDWWAKDKTWFKNRFNVDQVTFKVIRDPSAAFENLKKGNLDYMAIPFPDYWHDKSNDDAFTKGLIHKIQFYNDAPRSDYVLILNQQNPLFQDKKVRLAFQYAMNVDKVIKQVLRGDYQRLQGISQGYGAYTNPNIKARPFDLTKANQLLDEAGWGTRNAQGIRTKAGKTLSVTISYGQANIAPRLVVLREEAKKAGIDLQLKQMDPSALWNSYLEKKHDIAFVSWSTRFRPEYWGQFHSENANKPQNNNFSNTALPELDLKITTYRASTNEKERIKLAHDIQQIIHDEATHIPLFEVPYYRLAYWGWLKFPNPPATKLTDGIDLFSSGAGGLFWIDDEAKKVILEAKRRGKALPAVTIVDETFRVKI